MKRHWERRSLPEPFAQSVHRYWQRLGLPQSFCLHHRSRHLHSQAMLSRHTIEMLLSTEGAVGDIQSKKRINNHPRILPAQIHILDWLVEITVTKEIKFRKDVKIIEVFVQCGIYFPEHGCSTRKELS